MLLVDPALKAFAFFVFLVVMFCMVVIMMLAVLQVARLFLYGASRVLRQPFGFFMPPFFAQSPDFPLPLLGKAP